MKIADSARRRPIREHPPPRCASVPFPLTPSEDFRPCSIPPSNVSRLAITSNEDGGGGEIRKSENSNSGPSVSRFGVGERRSSPPNVVLGKDRRRRPARDGSVTGPCRRRRPFEVKDVDAVAVWPAAIRRARGACVDDAAAMARRRPRPPGSSLIRKEKKAEGPRTRPSGEGCWGRRLGGGRFYGVGQ